MQFLFFGKQRGVFSPPVLPNWHYRPDGIVKKQNKSRGYALVAWCVEIADQPSRRYHFFGGEMIIKVWQVNSFAAVVKNPSLLYTYAREIYEKGALKIFSKKLNFFQKTY